MLTTLKLFSSYGDDLSDHIQTQEDDDGQEDVLVIKPVRSFGVEDLRGIKPELNSPLGPTWTATMVRISSNCRRQSYSRNEIELTPYQLSASTRVKLVKVPKPDSVSFDHLKLRGRLTQHK